jgi:hypothetical protein
MGVITEGQYVKLGISDQFVVAATANSRNLGIALNSVTLADLIHVATYPNDLTRIQVEVAMIGIAPTIVGEGQRPLVADEYVKSDAAGYIVPVTGNGTDEICGRVLRDTATGEETHVQILHIPPND